MTVTFLFGAAVSMQSVVMHNPDLAVKFHLFTDYIDEDYLQRVNAFTSKNANVEVRIYKVSNAFIDIFPSLKQWSYATFFRLVAFQYLSETIENLLYIDADVICKGSLAGLLDINFDGDKFAAVIKDVPLCRKTSEASGYRGTSRELFQRRCSISAAWSMGEKWFYE